MFIDKKVYDIIGIGIGPFNLGMAAIADSLPQLSCLFFDQSREFVWHEGMLLPNARLQVPFYADLVTVIDPCSWYSYLNYLREKKRLFRFAIHENNFVTRREYNDYCRWVAGQLDSLRFNHKVADVHYDPREDIYCVMVHNLYSETLEFYYCKHLVIGIGTVPYIPECIRDHGHDSIVHSSAYLKRKEGLLTKGSITVVGSGQSAAEVFYDLLSYTDSLQSLNWMTRSMRFYPMEYSKLTLEMTSLDYIDHFYSLPGAKKKKVLSQQDVLYKGINSSLINEIYDLLYLKGLENADCSIGLKTNSELLGYNITGENISLQFLDTEVEQSFQMDTSAVILATGYRPGVPTFLESIKDQLNRDEDQLDISREYAIDVRGKRIFVQNAELHSHGFCAPDLGMGPYRNATILNKILGYEHFALERGVAFQEFGIKN
jgi:lysine N6-hydroxylase